MRFRKIALYIILLLCSSTFAQSKMILFDSRIEKLSVNTLLHDMQEADKTPGTIVLELNSLGGIVMEALRAGEGVAKLKNPVVCLTSKRIASAAPLILPACRWRVMTPDAQMMLHEPVYELGPLDTPIIVRRVDAADLLKGLTDRLNMMSVVITYNWKIGPEEFRARVEKGDWIMSAKEALDIGATDFVLPRDTALRVFAKKL